MSHIIKGAGGIPTSQKLTIKSAHIVRLDVKDGWHFMLLCERNTQLPLTSNRRILPIGFFFRKTLNDTKVQPLYRFNEESYQV